jgi:hypothetical protein
VNSSAMTARHPDVPNLICVAIFVISLRAAASRQQVLADKVPIALGCWNYENATRIAYIQRLLQAPITARDSI